MTKLKYEDVELRPVKLSDAEFLFECEQDEEARRNFMSTPKDVKEVRDGIRKVLVDMKRKLPSQEDFAIEWNGQVVGKIWVDGMDSKYEGHKASIGYMIHKDFRGKGIGTKAIKLITNYAFDKYKLKRIATFTRDFNIGSRRALEKAGYKLEGILVKNKFKDGKYLNDCLYAIVR